MRPTYLTDPARHETVFALDLAENVVILPNPAYEPITALDLADVCMTKNPSYVTIQPWQREPVAQYKARTIGPSPTSRSRPLPPLLKDNSILHRINQTMPLPVPITKTASVHDGGNVEEVTSPVYTSEEGIACDKEVHMHDYLLSLMGIECTALKYDDGTSSYMSFIHLAWYMTNSLPIYDCHCDNGRIKCRVRGTAKANQYSISLAITKDVGCCHKESATNLIGL